MTKSAKTVKAPKNTGQADTTVGTADALLKKENKGKGSGNANPKPKTNPTASKSKKK